MDLNNLKGIGEKTEKLFYKAGIEKVNDLLRYYPRNSAVSSSLSACLTAF